MHKPIVTYRLQFHAGFGFRHARSIVPYLRELGVTDLYASPLLNARRASTHGYDVTDPTHLNPALGTRDEFDALIAALDRHGMGLVLDIVPNHMAASVENPWWCDVLEFGRGSAYAPFFDIDWSPTALPGEATILLPMLGQPFGSALEGGELQIAYDSGRFVLRYYETALPLAPWTWVCLASRALEHWNRQTENDSAGRGETQSVLSSMKSLRLQGREGLNRSEAARRQLTAVRDEFDQLKHRYASLDASLQTCLNEINGRANVPESFNELEAILDAQSYRLAYWKTAAADINYRRFFNISDLVSVRVEDERVFDATHALILELIRTEKIKALRIDHIDGLFDPAQYLQRLRSAIVKNLPTPQGSPVYTVVEKILESKENLPDDWATDGTTGYDFLNVANAVFVHPEGLSELKTAYHRFIADTASIEEICRDRKRQIMRDLFPGEIYRLVDELYQIANLDRHARDLTWESVHEALVEMTACLPVYRTYIRDRSVTETDRAWLNEAASSAADHLQHKLFAEALRFVHRVLRLDAGSPTIPVPKAWVDFVMRWQQLSGPVMAKGLEDTTLYVFGPLLSLNEVGGDADGRKVPSSIEAFHRGNEYARAHWPVRMTASATHDTKRGEDVRARLNVLSEQPDAWRRCLARWSRWNRVHKRKHEDTLIPDQNDEHFLYQTLVGVWPLTSEGEEDLGVRIREYLVKAAREAKTHTNWREPNEAYESAWTAFADALLEPGDTNRFRQDFQRFHRRIAYYGVFNGLGQILLKLTSPGVPDTYQGTEYWDLSLVDPDNRRPVDFEKRASALADLRARERNGRSRLLHELVQNWPDGRIKLYMIAKTLSFRRDHPGLFLEGDYVPLRCEGERHDHVCAFARRHDDAWVVTAVPRWTSKLTARMRPPQGASVWRDTRLVLPANTPQRWRNVLTDEALTAESDSPNGCRLSMSNVLQTFPVALLQSENTST